MEQSESDQFTVFPFHHVLLDFTAYYILEGILKLLCRHLRPEFYDKLKSEERYLPFFGFIMGWLTTLFSTPICLYAFITDDHTKETYNIAPAGQICIASRSVLWVSELNRLEYVSAFIKHHLAALAQVSGHLHSELPLAPLYLVYASLVTELLSTAAAILTICGYKSFNSPLAKRIQIANAIAVPIVRTPPVVYAFLQYCPQLQGGQWIAAVLMLVAYQLSFLKTTVHEFRRLKIVSRIDMTAWFKKGFQSLNPFGCFAAAAYLGLIQSTWIIYTLSGGLEHRNDIVSLLFQASIAGWIGARLPCIATGHQILSRTGYWLQPGMVAAAVVLLLSPGSNLDTSEKIRLLSSAAISLSLGEGIGRFGCHFGGCCGSNSHETRRSVALLAGCLCISTYAVVVAAWLQYFLNIYQAAAITVTIQGCIRIVAETMRDDIDRTIAIGRHRITTTLAFAVLQVVMGATLLLITFRSLKASAQPPTVPDQWTTATLPSILAALSLPLSLTQACGDGGSEAISGPVGSPAVMSTLLALPLSFITACGDGGAESSEPLQLAMPLAALSLTKSCGSGGSESIEKDRTHHISLPKGF